MRRVFASVVALAALLGVGCNDSGVEQPDGPEALAQQVGAVDRDVEDVQTICRPGNVWRSTSRRIEVTSFGFWEGSSGYRAERAALTAAQQRALTNLCVRPTPRAPVVSDVVSYRVAITDSNGSVTTYRAVPGNALEGDEPDHTLPTLDFATLDPFLETFDCLRAAESRVTRATRIDPEAPWRSAPTLPSDPACLHGVFAPYNCGDTWLKLSMRTAKRQTLAVDKCVGTLQITLYDATGTRELASSSPATAPRCPSLSYSFPAGTYLVQLRKTNGQLSCEARGAAGDYFLKVSP